MAGKAEVKYDSAVMNAAAVTQLIEDLGFGASLIEDNAVTQGKLHLTVSLHTMWQKIYTKNGINLCKQLIYNPKYQ